MNLPHVVGVEKVLSDPGECLDHLAEVGHLGYPLHELHLMFRAQRTFSQTSSHIPMRIIRSNSVSGAIPAPSHRTSPGGLLLESGDGPPG